MAEERIRAELPEVPTTIPTVAEVTEEEVEKRVAEMEQHVCLNYYHFLKMDAVAERKKRIEELKRKKAQLLAQGDVQDQNETGVST